MRLTFSLAIIALAAATPAAAQNEAVDPAAAGAANVVDSNAVAPLPADPANVTVADPAAQPADADVATAETDLGAEDRDDHDRGFPWGLVGLVGLVGLLGRRRSD